MYQTHRHTDTQTQCSQENTKSKTLSWNKYIQPVRGRPFIMSRTWWWGVSGGALQNIMRIVTKTLQDWGGGGGGADVLKIGRTFVT